MNRRELMQAGTASLAALALPAVSSASIADSPFPILSLSERLANFSMTLTPQQELLVGVKTVDKLFYLDPFNYQRYEVSGKVFMVKIISPHKWQHKDWIVIHTMDAKKTHIPYPCDR